MKLVDNLNVLNTQLKNEIKMYKKSMKDAQADAAKVIFINIFLCLDS